MMKMKKTTILIIAILIFYLNLFLLKSNILNLFMAILIIAYPLVFIPALNKNRTELTRKDRMGILITWGVAILPTTMVFVMTIIFGLPPKGYSPFDFFGIN